MKISYVIIVVLFFVSCKDAQNTSTEVGGNTIIRSVDSGREYIRFKFDNSWDSRLIVGEFMSGNFNKVGVILPQKQSYTLEIWNTTAKHKSESEVHLRLEDIALNVKFNDYHCSYAFHINEEKRRSLAKIINKAYGFEVVDYDLKTYSVVVDGGRKEIVFCMVAVGKDGRERGHPLGQG